MRDRLSWQRAKQGWLAVAADPSALDRLEEPVRTQVLRLSIPPAFDFLESTAVQLAAPWIADERALPEPPPERLGPWRVLHELGRGGMATVYLAERADGAFEKQVAVKILNAGLTGEEVRRRFQRERQVLARLDHPNIVRLLDGGVAPDSRPYLVTDFVDGLPLKEHVGQRQLSQGERIALFRQICAAVAYAHGQGVVHRDLKPANICITRLGQPKLLDFGIAKLHEPTAQLIDDTQTRAPFLTWAYASPEQARGESGGPSSDIYSLGVLLCELLSGRLPYDVHGLTAYQATRLICEARPNLPVPFADLVARMLDKDPARRPQAVEVIAAIDAGPAPVRRSPRWGRWPAALAVGAIAAALLTVWLLRNPPASAALSVVAAGPASQYQHALSPDGRSIVFSQAEPGSTPELLMRDLHGGAPRTLVRHRHPIVKSWSPDGKLVAFLDEPAGGGFVLYTVQPNGEGLRMYRSFSGAWLSWMPDSLSLLVCHREEGEPISVYHFTLETGHLRRVSFPRAGSWGDIQVAASPDGKSFAVARYRDVGKGDLYLVPMDGSDETRRLTRVDDWTNGFVFTPDGREIVASLGDSIVRVRVDGGPPRTLYQGGGLIQPSLSRSQPPRLAMTQRAWRSQTRVATVAGARDPSLFDGSQAAALSPDGRSLAYVKSEGRYELWLSDPAGERADWIATSPGGAIESPDWSPDGAQIAFTARPLGKSAVYIADVAQKAIRRLTQEVFDEDRPSWSPDSQSVYFIGNRSGMPALYRASARGGGQTELVMRGVFQAKAGPNGSLFYTVARDSPLLEKRPGQVARLVPGGGVVRPGTWGIAKEGLYFVHFHGPGHAQEAPVMLYRFQDRTVKPLVVLQAQRTALSLSISADAALRRFAWTESKPDMDIVVLSQLPF